MALALEEDVMLVDSDPVFDDLPADIALNRMDQVRERMVPYTKEDGVPPTT